MAANYVLLEKITVGAAGASSVTFNSIPQTGYTDLVVKMSCRFDLPYDAANLNIRFNGDSGANYSTRRLKGTGSAAQSDSTSSATTMVFNYGAGDTLTANTFNNGELYIPNYTSSNYKSVSSDVVTENNATAAYAVLQAGLWSNTAAITSIAIGCDGNWKQYSTFYLYGVAKLGTTPAIQPYATGGDTIMTDGTYWYHTFLSSGTFTPAKSLTCDYLVVAGGGAGGGGTFTNANGGGGGGAGGYRTSIGGSALSLGTSGYTVTVGAGGSGAQNYGGNGSNSVFASITSTGGGGGGAEGVISAAGRSGGSGGGAGGATAGTGGTGNAGSYSPVEGYAGGGTTGNGPGAGGGGSSAVGSANSGLNGGAGGNGTANSISGTSVTYAGGGGGGVYSSGTGGTGGTGGGGAGSNASAVGTAGTANTGGGGGGSSSFGAARSGANGGSGIVIVRYAV